MEQNDLSRARVKTQRAVALFFLVLILVSMVGAQRSPVALAIDRGERIPMILFGVDAADASRHTDTLMIGVFDPVRNYLSVLSIPRDTRIDLPGYRFNRVNEIYGYTLRKTSDMVEASQKVIDGVTYLLSSDTFQPTIKYFVQIDFAGFRRMIDLLGGVWIVVKQPMHYDDNAGNTHIHFEPGRYLLKGDDALRYVRFRGPTGDRGRIFRQQEFVRSLLRSAANPLTVLRFPEFVAALDTAINSNMSVWDMVYFVAGARRLRSADIGFYILPGQMSGVYWSPKREMVQQMAAVLFLGKTPVLEGAAPIAPQANKITIKVWNASGKTGFGYDVTKFLRKSGYDVLDWGNYSAEQLQTRVIDRRGSMENARAVAGSLGVENFHSEPNPKALVDVEVVIGQNYTGVSEEKK